MNLRAFIVLSLLLAAVFSLAVVAAAVDDTKHAVGNQVEDSKLWTCKYGKCKKDGGIPSIDEAKYELDQGGRGGGDGLDEDESKYGQGGREGVSVGTLQGGGDTERGGGGGDTERGGGGGDRQRRGRRGRRGGRGGGW